jgi:hypothetical protein
MKRGGKERDKIGERVTINEGEIGLLVWSAMKESMSCLV